MSPDAGTGATTRPSGWRLVRALLSAVLGFLSAVAYAPAFARTAAAALTDLRFTGAVAGAVATVTATCLLLAVVSRWSPVTRVACGAVTLTTYLLLVLAPGRAVFEGPRRLLTTALPIDPAGAELATVVAVVGLATLGAVEPALRRPASLLPLLAPLVATGAGIAVTASAGPPAWWLAPAIALGAAGLLLAARQDRAVTRTPLTPVRAALAAGRVTAALGALTVATLSGPVLLSQVGSDRPADARDLVAQPVRPRQLTTPLQLFPALRTGRQVIQLQVSAERRPDRMRYVTLHHFDGQYWTTSATYRRAGTRLPLGENTRGETRTERVRITRPGPLGWLVSSGRPTEVSISDLGVNEDTGDVVFPADRRLPGEYTVTSTVTTAMGSELESATPAPLPDGAALGTRAAPAPELVGKASAVTAGAYGYPALRRLAEFFSAGEFATDISTNPPAGHGLYQIQRLFERKIGTAEQYASAYAVLARALGYHARVVVGFIPGESGTGVYPVSGRDVHAWVEVEFADLGWVAFDPTPGRTGRGGGPDPSPEPHDSPTPSKTPSPDVPASPATTPPRDAAGGGLAAAAGDTALPVTSVLAGVLILGAIAVPVVKSVRRRRRRTDTDLRRRVLAAWRDTVDRLVESGVPVARGDTTWEVVTAGARRYGPPVTEPLRALAPLRDQAAYGTSTLPLSTGDTAWLHADLARRAISRALPSPRRWRALLDPRPLLRGHR